MTVQTYWLEPTDQVAVGLRRYSIGDGGFDCQHGHHRALVYTGREKAQWEDRDGHRVRADRHRTPAKSNRRWPKTCDHCDHRFVDGDHWQRWTELLYRRTDSGELRVLHQGGAGSRRPLGRAGGLLGRLVDALPSRR